MNVLNRSNYLCPCASFVLSCSQPLLRIIPVLDFRMKLLYVAVSALLLGAASAQCPFARKAGLQLNYH